MSEPCLFRADAYVRHASARVIQAQDGGALLDRTLFYPTGGGQPGDTGLLRWQGGEARVADTRKGRWEGATDATILHLLADGAAAPPHGATVDMVLDWDRRYAHMRMHTCLHLLSALLRDAAVTGGQVGDLQSRLDFDLPSGVIDKDQLTEGLNRLIQDDLPVTERWITDDELAAQPDLVRTLSVKPPTGHGRVRLLAIGDGVDLQPCGGTHVRRTGEIGPVEVVKIVNKGKQNRRVVVALAS